METAEERAIPIAEDFEKNVSHEELKHLYQFDLNQAYKIA